MRKLAIGYHASHEQLAPSALLRHVRHAEQAGFAGAMCSDHFLPWGEKQGQSGFAWAWLGAALEATSLSFGTVCAPGYRYHPAVIAQAAATLAEMYPGRFWLSIGSGEALNEHITGEKWPDHAERTARLEECAEVIRALWRGEEVTHRGRVVVDGAKLYTRPAAPPRLLGAAISAATAARVGRWADGLITVSQGRDQLREVVRRFREGGGEGKPMVLQVKIAYDPDERVALREAHEQWRTNVLPPRLLASLTVPEHFDAAASFVRPEDVAAQVHVSADPARHAAWLREHAELGFDAIYVHNVTSNQQAFIDTFGERVLPALLK
ncbi:luciferase [Sorangium cellulosum]|uniref:Luciferase n=1 Tax=Sorangium cellulosum TaxID=56 RepID=A0A2L0EMQ1_SORCE|nr:TIGR03885 family FMN-dependent LLM class oxidoreductase [Sorangium cellulosum]AUX40581.1 luciferase [Sorangium cellulosum]